MKTYLKGFVFFLFYRSGVVGLFYFLNRHAKRIVTFHNVLPDNGFEWNPETGFSHSASQFRAIVRELKKRWCFSNDLSDVGKATITFDDGNVNQYEIAAEILKEEGNIPAIIFCSGGQREGVSNGLIVDKLCFWASYAPIEYLRTANNGNPITRSNFWSKILRPKFANDSFSKGYDTVRWLDEIYPFSEVLKLKSSEYLRLRFCGISKDQIANLRGRGWIVAWHTKNHFPLSSLGEVDQISEMTPPKDMEDVVFSYPYGERASVDDKAIEHARQIGFPCAVSDIVDLEERHSRYFIPRYDMPPYDRWFSKYRLHFELSGLHYFIKNRRLLPRGVYGNN